MNIKFSKREISSLITLVLLLVAIPVAVNLLKDSQIFRSRASVEAVKFTGPNIKLFGSLLAATSENVEIEVQDPFLEGGASPSPTPTPTGPRGTPQVDIISISPTSPGDNEDVTITYSTAGATSVNLWLNIDKNASCERWNNDSTCSLTNGPIIMQMNNLSDGNHTLTWPSNYPGHHPGTHEIGLHAYYCPKTGYPDLVTDGDRSIDCTGGTPGELDKREITITGSDGGTGGAPSATIVSVVGTVPTSNSTVTFTTTGANTVNLWVDCGERWSSTDGSCGNDKDYVVQVNNLTNGTHTIPWPANHPRHTAGAHSISVHPYICTNSFSQSIVSGLIPASQTNPCDGVNSRGGGLAPVQTVNLTSGGGNPTTSSYLMRIILNGTQASEFRCPVSANLFGSGLNSCQLIRSYSAPTLKYTSEWISNFGSTAYLMRIVALTDGNVTEYRCPLNPGYNSGVNMDPSGCTNVRTYNVPTLKYTSEWIANFGSTPYLMRVVALTDGNVTEYRCALNSAMNLGVNMDVNTCTNIRSYNVPTLKYTSEWVNGGNLIRLVATTDGEISQYSCALNSVMNLGANMDTASCTRLGGYNDSNLKYTSEWISDSNTSISQATPDSSQPSSGGLMSYLPSISLVTEAYAQTSDCPAPKQYFSCQVDCGAGKIAVNGRFCYDPNGIGGPCTPTSATCADINTVARTAESCTNPPSVFPSCGSAACTVISYNGAGAEIGRATQASCTTCAAQVAQCNAAPRPSVTTAPSSVVPSTPPAAGGGGSIQPTLGPSAVPAAFPSGTKTIKYKFSDDPSASDPNSLAWTNTPYSFDYVETGGNRKPFTFGAKICTTQPCDQYPRELRRVYVLFIGKLGTQEFKRVVPADITLAIAPRIDSTSCDLSNTGSGMLVTVKGVHFGNGNGTTREIGSIRVKDKNQEQTLVVPSGSWTNVMVAGNVPAVVADTGDVTLTTIDGQVSNTVACTPGKSQIDFKATLACRTVDKPLTTADIEIKEASSGASVFKQEKVAFSPDGRPQGVLPKLTEGLDYKFIIQAPLSLTKTILFKATKGTTAFQAFNLPLGDIYPDRGDCTINNLDRSQMTKQWSAKCNVTPANTQKNAADLDQNSCVNSLDYSCLISNFNKSCDRL